MLTRWLWCVWLVFAVACVSDDLVACEDGSACPVGKVCHATGCLVPAQVSACADKAELAPCAATGIPEGVCTAGACIPAGCGNGFIEPTETCDDGNRIDRDGCAGNCLSDETCGNGYLDSAMGEECDDANAIDGDACQTTCKLPACGDGTIDASRNEKCDDGASNSDTTPDACRTNCQPAGCPDGVVDGTEMCDDGNNNNGDDCRNDCVLPSCGNGVREVGLGEECDDGNVNSGDTCQANCKIPVCGDGVRDLGLNEACDEGATNSLAANATCRPSCQLPRCGDTVVDDQRDETCDDGNLVSGDGCRPNCTAETCGDGIPDFGRGEQCDDGNQDDQDGCRFMCKLPTCGDAITDATLLEECDAGAMNSMMPNSCRPGCQLPACGDSVIDVMFAEVCDDGNSTSGDGCRPNCTAELCGDSIIDSGRGEQCDAGAANSLLPNAACRPLCTLPTCGDGVKDTNLFEECDAGLSNTNLPDAACRPGCRVPRCGDNVVDTTLGEQCDGTSNPTGFPCSSACKAQRCGNGILDPAEQCDDGNSSNADFCHTSCQLPTCGDGIIDPLFNEQCDAGGANANTPGACRPTCRLPVCGDAVGDPGEVCDDGNTAVGDGCTPDCGSDETCGNGRLDTAASEECDDRNQRSHDGCSSRCVLEFPRWTNVTPGQLPARLRHAAVYDAARARLVVFGGEPVQDPSPTAPLVLLSDTWEYDGTGWLQRRPTTAPSARKDHALVYDARDGLVYLFGGVTASGARLNDVWAWNGTTWTQVTTTGTAPSPRSEAAVAYDTVRGQLVVFGGRTATAYLGDTWVLRDRVWNLLTTTGPSARSAAAVGYDPIQGAVVLAGGETSATGLAADTWMLDDTTWTQVGDLDAVRGARMTWSPAHQRLVLLGGLGATAYSSKVWQFNVDRWTALTTTGAPARAYHTLTTLIDQGGIVAVGGTKGEGPSTSNVTLTGDTWSSATENLGPSSRVGVGVTYDPIRGVTVMYGGIDGGGVTNETWEWNGLSWRQAATSVEPRGAVAPMMAYSTETRELLLQGGSDQTTCEAGVQSATWRWDGVEWTQRDGSSGGEVCAAAPAMHATQHALLKVGGWGNGSTARPTTQKWESGTWVPWTGDAPDPVSGRTLAYDPVDDRLVQFGSFEQEDTNKLPTKWWTWKMTWSGQEPEVAPPPRKRNTLVYDPLRMGITLFGGTGFAGPLDDVWIILRNQWQQVAASMPATYDPWSPAITYHDAAATFVAVAAPASSGGTTFALRYESRTPDETCTLSLDRDGDGKRGIDDPDCWPVLNALCPPCASEGTCTCDLETCGDTVCSQLEDERSCAQDCGNPVPRCGDYRCDPAETCPGDCS